MFIRKTVELANKYGVSVDENVMSSVKVTNLNMVVYRLFGFGGRSVAVPLLPPFVTWVEPWLQSQKELP